MAPSRYHSPLRADGAAATRTAILESARELFLTRGYAGTTVSQIARAAGVAVPTVYTSTGGKADILAALLEPVVHDAAVGRTTAEVEASEDPVGIIRAVAEGVRLTHERHWETVSRLFPQAESEPAAAEVHRQIIEAYQAALGRAADRLATLGALRPGMSGEDALDIIWFYLGAGAWPALCRDRGWSLGQAAGWLTAAVTAALLPEDDETRSGGRSGSR